MPVALVVLAAALLPGVDAALMVPGTGGDRRTVALGISAEEAGRIVLEAPESTNVRAVEVVYRYRLDDAGGALVTARRFDEARQLAEVDALTGLFNRRQFHQSLQREVARTPVRAQARARGPRPRSLQADQRHRRTSGRRTRCSGTPAGGSSRSCASPTSPAVAAATSSP